MKSARQSLGPDTVLIVFVLPAMRGGFVWDDDSLITENRLVKASDGFYRF